MTDDIKQVGEAFVRTDLDDYGDDDHHRRDVVDPIVVADGGVRCEYCNAVFDRDAAATTSLPSTTLFRCPSCERWTEAE